ncbi:hypothetical protein GCM10018987_17690 [Streptomyces cremeus]
MLEKAEIARDFPANWTTPELERALESGEAEFVLSTGTNHARMQLIRPPYFLLRSYYRLWAAHPELGSSWHDGARRVSLTTVLATEHVARVNAAKPGATPGERWLDDRTLYLNRQLDPADWDEDEVRRMLAEIREVADAHPKGAYLLDCSGYHLAHLVRKVDEWNLWEDFPPPVGIVHAYEYTPLNVRTYLRAHFDCPVVDLFGSTELGYLFYSDADGRYQPYLHDMSVELLPVEPGSGIHSLIVTSIRNPYMPLVRYRSGDCVRTRDGSTDPAQIESFCGREKELLPTPRGPVAQADLDAVIAGVSPRIFLHQLETAGPADALLRYTTFDGSRLDEQQEVELATAIKELTTRQIRIEHRTRVPIGKSGKYAWLAARSPENTATDAGTELTAARILGPELHAEVVRHFSQKPDAPDPAVVAHQVRECARYLYLVSRHPDRLAGLFLPVEQDIDEIWHFLILQTREYRELCEQRLPGGHFIHHRSISYDAYRTTEPATPQRTAAAEEALRWIPFYRQTFGGYDEEALPHWTVVRFLHQELGLSLEEINALDG